MNDSLVSVIIPTYQRAHTLRRAIKGALAQTYSPLEVIVSDNASTDGTVQILTAFDTDERVRVIRQPQNVGAVPNWRAAVAAAQGRLIKVNWSDDWMDPRVVEDLVVAFNRQPAAGFAITGQTIHYPTHSMDISHSPRRIALDDVIGSILLGLGLPVSPGAALVERGDALWALDEGCSRLPATCAAKAIGPDLLMLYGALRDGRTGVHTGLAGVHFEGGSDSITVLENRDRLRTCYRQALRVLVDAADDPVPRATFDQLTALKRAARTLRRQHMDPGLQQRGEALPIRSHLAGLMGTARQAAHRIALPVRR